jgi:hypothetical protein
MPIAYVAQTRDHLLMLDEDGVCLHVHRRSKDRGDDAVDGAIRCIGAQYVAALDPAEPGFLGHAPTIGAPLLFAKADGRGKISVIRTGPLERFEVRGSGLHDRLPATAHAADPTGAADALAQTQRTVPATIRYLPEDDGDLDDGPESDEDPTLRARRPAGVAGVRPPGLNSAAS